MISVLVCTHNRAEILSACLDSLASQTIPGKQFEVIVIDNASTDNTHQVVSGYLNRLHDLKYVVENKIGLSHARNRGYLEASNDWVVYIDDDAKASSNLVERTMFLINNFDFDCIGGRFFPWYRSPKPKWLPDDFGLFPLLRPTVGELEPTKYGPGGIIVFRKNALRDVGGFPANLGMSGANVGYGEENWVQDEMRKKGYAIGFDPELKIDHLVAEYKYNLLWHFKRQYAKGKAARILSQSPKGNPIFLMCWAILVTFKELLRNSFKLMTKKDYFYQNYFLDSLSFLIKTTGLIQQ